jgi:hypothetical protein
MNIQSENPLCLHIEKDGKKKRSYPSPISPEIVKALPKVPKYSMIFNNYQDINDLKNFIFFAEYGEHVEPRIKKNEFDLPLVRNVEKQTWRDNFIISPRIQSLEIIPLSKRYKKVRKSIKSLVKNIRKSN